MPHHYRFVIMPLGSAGDVHPLIWIAKRLRERGHEVIVLCEDALLDIPQRAGLDTIALGKKEEQEAILKNPDLWHPRKAFKVVATFLPHYIRDPLHIIERFKDDPNTILITGSLAFAGRIAHERWNLPHISVHLQPSLFMSVDQTPVMVAGAEPLTKAPRFVRRALMWYVDRTVDKTIGPAVNAIRAEFGLSTPATGIMRSYWHGPDGVIALFPDWYARQAADWPAATQLTRFPLYDESEEPKTNDIPGATGLRSSQTRAFDENLSTFLHAGPKPILVTPGSANAHGGHFFNMALGALTRLNRRGIFLTRYPDQLPPNLPASIAAFQYIPFSQVLPDCAAIIHHGGIGTCAQAMAAGIPQLLMPMAHDQPDNGTRLRRLGIGDYLYPKKFKPKAIAEKIAHLTSAREVLFACRGVKQMIADQMTPAAFCEIVEHLSQTALAKRGRPLPANLTA